VNQKVTISSGVAVALMLGGLLAWSQWTDMKADEPVVKPMLPPPANAKVLDPKRFVGAAATGYLAAQSCPEIIANLFCYCGCDMTDKHNSLLDCFTTEHGADCPICTDEAILASRLKQAGQSVAEIQQAVDKKFAKEYPFDSPSLQLVRYKAKALGMQANMNVSTSEPKLKPGAKAGDCCGGAKKTQ
jgi:hypothetical protein